MSTGRGAYLLDLADVLWPAPEGWQLVTGRGAAESSASGVVDHSVLVVPSASRPRVLLPSSPRLSAAAVRHGPGGKGARARLSRRALAVAMRLGLGPRIFRDRLVVYRGSGAAVDGSLTGLLHELGGPGGAWAMPVTRDRANRKPVIQVLDRRGTPTAFVKVGTDELTRRLVRSETETLTRLAGELGGIEIPRVLDAREIGDLAVLVLSPLAAASQAVEPAWDDVVALATALASVGGVTRSPLGGHPYWASLGERLRRRDDARSSDLLHTWERLDAVAGVELPWGAWHGDFAPWNLSRDGATTVVWDFERFEDGVPMGLDLVHYDVQTRILRPGSTPEAVVGERRQHAPRLLGPMGLSDSESALVFVLYLLDISARWIEDGQDRFGQQSQALDAMVSGAALGAGQIVEQLVGDSGRDDT